MEDSDSETAGNNFIITIKKNWHGLPFAFTWARVNYAFLCFYQRRRW